MGLRLKYGGPSRAPTRQCDACKRWQGRLWFAGQEIKFRELRETSDGLLICDECDYRDEHPNETWWLSSDLIIEATAAVQCWAPEIWPPYQHVGAMLITSVDSEATARRRSRHHAPGWCFRCAGWVDFDHAPGRADVWLRCPPHAQPHPRRASLTPPDQMELWA